MRDSNCLISQREIGVHAQSFSQALHVGLARGSGRDSGR
jgi:Tfp pilus assembly pilus retraction ATPase PilT